MILKQTKTTLVAGREEDRKAASPRVSRETREDSFREPLRIQERRGQKPLRDRVGAYRSHLKYRTRLVELRYGGSWPGEIRPWPGGPQPLRVSPLCCRWAAPSWPQRSPPQCHLRHSSEQQLVSASLALTSGRAGGRSGVLRLRQSPLGKEKGTGGN